ncbi:hypothetical protein R6Q57_021628 [Mikania cordata]
MVLEATMICIDNSEWMRNGDYSPTRFQAQAEAVNLICGAKTQSNPENTVGVLTMAGKGVRVLVTPTSDLGKILACMHGLEIGGEMNLAAGILVAQLALKHRQNKKQQQRIIVFAGGPVKYDKKVLEMIGKKLKKNSVALDVVNFGEEDEEKTEKLEALVAAVNNNDSSHIVHVPAGSNALSDVLLSTPIFTGDGEGGSGFAAAAAAAAAGGVSGFDFGVDPNLDPELALALRVSMEEERARQEAAAKKAADDSSKQEKGESTSQDATMSENAATSASESENKKDDLMVSNILFLSLYFILLRKFFLTIIYYKTIYCRMMRMHCCSRLLQCRWMILLLLLPQETLICQKQLLMIKIWHLLYNCRCKKVQMINQGRRIWANFWLINRLCHQFLLLYQESTLMTLQSKICLLLCTISLRRKMRTKHPRKRTSDLSVFLISIIPGYKFCSI